LAGETIACLIAEQDHLRCAGGQALILETGKFNRRFTTLRDRNLRQVWTEFLRVIRSLR
jgi:hypothetical protein